MTRLPRMIASRKRLFQRFVLPGDTLGQRVVHGGLWVFALSMSVRTLGVLRTLVLARVLAPRDFGLFGIALLAISTVQTFSVTGFEAALIQKRTETKPYLDTAWTVQVIRGAVLAVIVLVFSPYAAAFFQEPTAGTLLRALGLSLLLQGFTNIGVVYFQKELRFHKQFVLDLGSMAVSFGVAVTAAVVLRNAWALILGLLAESLARTLLSYKIDPYRPRLRLEYPKAKELYAFGKWILGSAVLIFLVTQGDDIFVGKLLGATALGLYQLAYRISNMPATEISHVIGRVTFPTYSKLQDDLFKLRQMYLKVLQLTAFLSTPLAGVIFILAGGLTRVLLGDKWMPMVPALQMLVIAGYVRSVQATTGPVFLGLGRPKLDTRGQMIRLFVLAASLYPLTARWGIVGASASVLLSILVCAGWSAAMILRSGVCRAGEFLRALVVPLVSTMAMICVTYLWRIQVGEPGITQLALLALPAAVTYLAATLLLDRFSNCTTGSLIRESMGALRGR